MNTSPVKYRFAILTLAASLLFSPVIARAADNAVNTEESDFTFATKAFNDGFYDIAESRLEAFLRDHPETQYLYEAHATLGRCYYYRNNYQRALYEFTVVLNSPAGDRFQDEALYWTGEIYLKTNDPKKALESYQKLVESHPASKYMGHALYSMGWAYKDLGFLEEAMAAFKDVVSKYPLDKIAIDSLFRSGECAYLLSKYAEAEKELNRFVNTFPVSEKTAEAYYLRGESEFYRAKYKEAAASFERAVSISPSSKWSLFASYRRASALFQTENYKESVEGFKYCLDKADTEFLAGLSLLGLEKNYEKLGLKDDAISICDRIISSYPSSETAAEAYYKKIKLLYSKQDYIQAEAIAKEGIEKFSKSRYLDKLRYELGWVYCSLGKTDDAINEFVWVETESKDINLSAGAVTKIGDIYFDRKEYQKALESYDIVLEKYSDSLWSDYAQYQVGNVSFASAKYDRAVLAYQNVLFNYPNTRLKEDVFFQLGMAYFKIGDFERSAAEFEKLLKLFPGGVNAEKGKLYLANCFYNASEYDKALPVFKELAKSAGDEEVRQMARYQVAWCFYNTGKEAPALTEFAAYIKDYPRAENAPDVVFWFAEYYDSKKDYEKAREYYSIIARDYQSSGMSEEALYQLAGILYEEGKSEEAINKFGELASRNPDSDYARRAYRKMAKIKKDLKDYDSAALYLGKALTGENNELNAQIQYEIAECAEGKGDLSKATEDYLKVTYLYSGAGAFWPVRATLACAKIFERMEKFEEARRLYEKLADMDVEESAFAKQRLEWIKWRTAN